VETLPRRGYRFLAPVVSKNVLAPAPRIIKSQSGVQSGIMREIGPDGTPIAPKADEAPPKADQSVSQEGRLAERNVVSKDKKTVASGMFPVRPAQTVARQENPVPREEATSAAAAAEALAPEIARLRKSPNRARGIVIWVVVALAALAAAALYWQLRQP
jgi:hypothetical protein